MTPGDLVNVYNVPALKREFVGQGVVLQVLDEPGKLNLVDEDGQEIHTVLVAFNDAPGQAFTVEASEIVPRSLPPVVEVANNEPL